MLQSFVSCTAVHLQVSDGAGWYTWFLLPLFEPILLPLIEEIRFGASQIHDLRTAVPVLLLNRAFLAVVCIRDTGSATDHAPALIRAIVALVADADECGGTDIRVTDHALAVTLLTQAADGDTRLLATKDEIGMMFGHDGGAGETGIRLQLLGKTGKDQNQKVNQGKGPPPHKQPLVLVLA